MKGSAVAVVATFAVLVAADPTIVRANADSATTPATMPVLDKQRLWRALDDPQNDGWATEALHEQVKKQLKALGSLLQGPRPIDPAAVAPLVADDFAGWPLLPDEIRSLVRNSTLHAEIGEFDLAAMQNRPLGPHRGAQGLVTALAGLANSFLASRPATVEFKIVRIAAKGGVLVTEQHVAMAGFADDGRRELHTTWNGVWLPPTPQDLPKLRWLVATDFERATTRTESPLFSDCTESALADNGSYTRQLKRSFNHWAERITDWAYYKNFASTGLAVGDVNGDGLDDVYLSQQAGLPNRLFVQRQDGTAEDTSVAAGVDWLTDTRGVLLVDLDNDGDQDLAAATVGHVVLASNDGDGKFRVRAVLPTADDTMSLSAVDYDNDGDLDLYACAYFPTVGDDGSRKLSQAGPAASYIYHDANDGGRNSLLRNDRAWTFSDVTREVGLDANNRRWSFAAAWEDYDNDGDQDLYVANDYGRNNLYRNDGGRFEDVAAAALAEDSASGMGVTWGDYDRDGWMDLYVSNMFSSAGSRIATQPEFQAGAPESVRARILRFAKGNTLLRNLGDGSFSDTTADAAVARGRWAWSSQFLDLNNDGWEDLIVANGYITGDDTGDL